MSGPSQPVLPPGDHGGDGPRLAALLGLPAGDVLDLSQSLNPVAPDPAAVLAGHLDALRRYPDEAPARHALAAAMGLDPDLLVLTNGGSEAIALVAAELGRGWVDEPDFSLYRRHLPALEPGAPRFRSNPHNPTGLLAPADDDAAVWDEAFFPLATGRWTRGDHEHGSTVVGSLTKLLACPGLRLGYVVAPHGDAARRLRRRQPQWSVSSLAVAALPALLQSVDLPGWCTAVRRLRAELVVLLRAAGLRVEDTDAAWVLVDDAGLRDRLLPHGILVRDCGSFGLPGVARVAVPDAAGLERLRAALR